MRLRASLPKEVLNTSRGVTKYAQFHSSVCRKELSYLDKPEMDALLAAPDPRTRQGMRDRTLLLFLYNSGARVTEAVSLRVGDLTLRANQIGSVQLRGKGNKTRRCPLWPATSSALLALIRNRSLDDHIFLSRLGQPITRHGVHWMLRKYIRVAAPLTRNW